MTFSPQPQRDRYQNGNVELEVHSDDQGEFLYIVKNFATFLMFRPEEFVQLIELLNAWQEGDEEDG